MRPFSVRFWSSADWQKLIINALAFRFGLFPAKNKGYQAGDHVDHKRQESLLVPSAHVLHRGEKCNFIPLSNE
jgi:hypothetical protein